MRTLDAALLSPRAPLAAKLAAPALLAAVVLAAGPAGAAECSEALSQGNTQRLFNALNRMSPADGCALESVKTDRSRASVVWKKGGVAEEAIVVLPTSCAEAPSARGKVLSMLVPPPVAAACPSAVEGMAALMGTETFGGLVALDTGTPGGPSASPSPAGQPVRPGTPPGRGFVVTFGIAAALLVVGAIAALVRRRSKRDAPS